METVLVVGSTGNIGVAAVLGALHSGRNVLAIVRNAESGEKLLKHVGKKDGITLAEADILSENGVQKIVDEVKAGNLPAFQHVFSGIGFLNPTTPMQKVDTAAFHKIMQIDLDGTFFAYRATVPYLIEQGHPDSTWTLITGGAGELGVLGVSAMSQGALFGFANAACKENAETNIRVNEIISFHRIEYDSEVDAKGGKKIRSSEFGRVYEQILANKEIDACRVTVKSPADVDDLKYQKKLAQ